MRLMWTAPPAASLLYHLWNELFGHGLAMLDLSRLRWCVLKTLGLLLTR